MKHTHTDIILLKSKDDKDSFMFRLQSENGQIDVAPSVSTTNLNDPDVPTSSRRRGGLVNLGNGDSENPMMHVSSEVLKVSIMGDLKPAGEIAALNADLEHPFVLKLDQHILVGEARENHLPHVCLRGLPPIHTCVHGWTQPEVVGEEIGNGRREREVEVHEGIPHRQGIRIPRVQRWWVGVGVGVGAPTTLTLVDGHYWHPSFLTQIDSVAKQPSSDPRI